VVRAKQRELRYTHGRHHAGTMSNDSLTSVQRALDILRALGRGPLRVQAVADAVGREKSQVSRTLKVLADAGFATRDPDTRAYRLGWQLFALAGGAGDAALRQEAPAVLRTLVQRTGEAAHVTVLAGNTAITVMTDRPGRPLEANEWIGRASPLPCTSAGRALLLDLDGAELSERLAAYPDRLPGTDRAPRTEAALRERLRAERAAGCTTAVEEYEPGLVAIAAPVRDFRGAAVAAVNVSAPVFRLPADALEPVAAAVRDAGERLSTALGHADGA
jgi:DNA-binding IclR family transcriptional regulator